MILKVICHYYLNSQTESFPLKIFSETSTNYIPRMPLHNAMIAQKITQPLFMRAMDWCIIYKITNSVKNMYKHSSFIIIIYFS